jgi:hypothetical protein
MLVSQARRRGSKAPLTLFAATALAALGFAAPAAAQAIDDKYWLEVSAYFPSINTDASVSRPGEPGTNLDLESDLGLNSHETLPAVYAGWRFTRHWTVTAEYYALDRDGNKTSNRDITFDGTTFPTSTSIDTEFHTDVYRLTVDYAFYKSQRAELGAGLGLHATDFSLGLKGNVSVGAAGVEGEGHRESFLAPLPTIGLYGTWEFTPKIIGNARVDWLSLNVDDYDGSITNAQAELAYRFNKAFQGGVGYRYVDYSLDANKKKFTASIDYKFYGPSLFLRLGFQ